MASSPVEGLDLACDGAVLTITLNRPDVRNALAGPMVPALAEIMRAAQQEAGLRCVLVTGAGDHFSAGGDIAGFAKTLDLPMEQRRAEFTARLDRAAAMVAAFAAFDRPIIARCRGAVAGAGLLFPLIADLVLADETATFVFAHRRIGLPPDAGVSWLLPRVVGMRHARRLLLTAAKVDAREALALGLVTSLHEAGELDAAVAQTVSGLAAAPLEAIRTTKRLLDAALPATLADQLAAERDGIAHCVGEPDFAEAVKAFLQRTKPHAGRAR